VRLPLRFALLLTLTAGALDLYSFF